MCIDELCRRWRLRLKAMGRDLLFIHSSRGGRDVGLAKPTTYMNESGRGVGQLLAHQDVALPELVLIYDDIDLPLGAIRIREKGSAGSHKGMQSVLRVTGSPLFPRIRIGIRGPQQKVADRVEYVLMPLPVREHELLQQGVQRAADAAQAIVAQDVRSAMNIYNRRQDSLLLEREAD